ncbi:MAG TPA: RnfABCDGE type electron transport complex subunit B [Casimicrobiaceae bacterium]|nr:RnfABCDGE type electron transport complex subunit B [Casimicrobiaceae bacterium]
MDTTAAVAERIDGLLPQTQCGRCGFGACRPYAEAIAAGEADIDRCPPGGPATIARLAKLLARDAKPLDRSCGEHSPLHVARVVEAECIGCTLCITACPVDAIIGAQKRMHAVLPTLCTGCELCIPACPVDCIRMQPANREWTLADADSARERHARRNKRIAKSKAERAREAEASSRKAAIDAALARARSRRAARGAA